MRTLAGFVVLLAFVGHAHASDAPRIVTLADATDRALRTHERIAAAAAEGRRAEIGGWKAWSAVAPSIEATGSYTREKDEITFPETLAALGGLQPQILQRDAVRGALTVTQPIVSPQFWSLRELGAADRRGAAEGLRGARQDVTLAVAEAYYGALRARSLLDVAREAVKLAELEAEHARARESEGEVLRSDVLRAETELERARQQVVAAAGATETALQRLARLAAIDGPFDVVEAPEPKTELGSADPFVRQALARSPEILRGERALEAAEAEERRLRSVLYPTAGLRFQYRLVDHETFAERSDFWDLVAGVQIPLLASGGSQWIEWEEQKARVQKARSELQGTRRDVELSVREALVAAQTLATREALAAKEESLAVESHRLLSEGYAEGQASSVDLLAALTARNAARTDHPLVRYDRAVALLRLQRATGALGEAPAEPYEHVVVTDEQIVTLELSKIAFDGAAIRPASRPTLDEIARAMLERAGFRVLIVHTPPPGPASDPARKLDAERTDAIARYLIDKGVPGERLRTLAIPPRDAPAAPAPGGDGRTEFRILDR